MNTLQFAAYGNATIVRHWSDRMTELPSTLRDLGNGLVMRSVAGADDVARVASFDALIHGAGSEPTWRAWMTAHPDADPNGWLFVEEQPGGRVVAALCLLPWRLRYCGVELRAAEMGVVGTLEEYRGRGLQRALNARFDALLRAGGFDLSHIQGIPYFYRQFGYEYAMPLEAWWRLEHHMLPAEPLAGYACRPASAADTPMLVRFYDEAAVALDVAAVRDETAWRYLLGPALETETAAETWIVSDAASGAAGYFRVAHHGFGEGLIVSEGSSMPAVVALAALHTIGRLARERGKPFVRLNLPRHHPLVVAGRALGAYGGHAYAWQVRLPDPAALLQKLAPVFERRLEASTFAGHTKEFVISLYRESLVLRFDAGHLVHVGHEPPGRAADLRLPPPLLAPLLLGHRTLAEISHMYPDATADAAGRPLVEVLFPPLRAWLYQQY
jgi:hypothetical protein